MKVNNALNPFLLLPLEVNLHILSYVPEADLIKRIFLVCHQFKELSYNQNQWKERTIRLYGRVKAEESFTKTKDWKLSYTLGSDGYVSELKDGIGNFSGKRVYPSKKEEIGEFQNYILIEGKRTSSDGVIIYEGEFKDGKLNGQGTVTVKESVYKGEFKDGKLNGQGTLTICGALLYEGEFKDNEFNGNGTVTSDLGVYKGEFKEGKLNSQAQ